MFIGMYFSYYCSYMPQDLLLCECPPNRVKEPYLRLRLAVQSGARAFYSGRASVNGARDQAPTGYW